MSESKTFFVPALPRAVLSSNGDPREPRNRWTKGHAKEEIGSIALQASIEAYPDVEPFDGQVDVMLVFCVRPSRNADCPRCLQRALENGNRRFNFNGECLCYRPTDPSNIGGEVTKSIIDYGVAGGPPTDRVTRLITDDAHQYVRYVLLGRRKVEAIEEEGVEVSVRAVEPQEAESVDASGGAGEAQR